MTRRLAAQNTYLTEMLKQAGLDAEARDVAERIQTVLTDEIHHRMKNMLTMVTALVRQTLRTSTNLADAEQAIGVRLLAMAKAHDLLLKADWRSAALVDVLRSAVNQHDTTDGRILLEGHNLEIKSAAILPLTLALNELCTNAIKYGALSSDIGQVFVSWSVDGNTFTLDWRERGGPKVVAPSRTSFGTKLIEQALPRQLGGTGQMVFESEGVIFRLTLPLDRMRADLAVVSEHRPAVEA